MRRAYVVPGAPRYPIGGVEQPWFGRIEVAAQLAAHGQSPVVVCGDVDLERYLAHAATCGLSLVISARNEQPNTRGDMRAAAERIASDSFLADVDDIIVVTCWYHQRSVVALRHALRAAAPHRQVRVRIARVWGKWPPNGFVNEVRGLVDYVFDRPQRTRGGHRYKACVQT